MIQKTENQNVYNEMFEIQKNSVIMGKTLL